MLNDHIHSAVQNTKRQNDENQVLFDQGVILGRQMGKIMKKFKKIRNINKNHKDVISRLETIGYGY